MKSSVIAFMDSVEGTDVAMMVSQSAFGFAALDMFHIAAIAVVFGMIAVLDLRLMGLAFKDIPVTELSRQVLPWTWVAFAIAVITGILMFTGQASRYSLNYRLPGETDPHCGRGTERARVPFPGLSGRRKMGPWGRRCRWPARSQARFRSCAGSRLSSMGGSPPITCSEARKLAAPPCQ